MDGVKGNPLDRVVTFRDLQTSGFSVDTAAIPATGTPIIGGSAGGGGSATPVGPTSAPTSLVATGIWFSIQLTWNNPSSNLQHIEVWRHTADNLSLATLIGITTGTFFDDYLGSNQTRYYWVRALATDGTYSAFNATAGTSGTTVTDPTDVVANLAGQLEESELTTALQTRLNKIETNETDIGVVETDISLLGARNGGATAFIMDTSTVKIDSDGGDTWATRLTTLSTADSNNSAAIATETSTRADETGKLQALYTMRAQLDTAGDPYLVGFGLSAYAQNGTHTGSNNAATLTDSTQAWTTNEHVGKTIFNHTDGSSASVTANTATTVTATLSGGTENDWDTGDDYTIAKSEFIIAADQFAITHPSYPGAPSNPNYKKYPFIVDATKGIIAIDGSLVVTGSITTTEIDADTITGNNIASLDISTKTITADTGTVGGWTLSANSFSSGNFTINATNEEIEIGSATAPTTGEGIWIGKDGADYEFRVGDPSNDYLHYDGTDLIQVVREQSFTPTWGASQFSSGPSNNTLYYKNYGTMVEIYIKASDLSGTGGASTSLSLNNLPTAIRPATTKRGICVVIDANFGGNNWGDAMFQVLSTGSLAFFPRDTVTNDDYGAHFNVGGTKGLPGGMRFLYPLE